MARIELGCGKVMNAVPALSDNSIELVDPNLGGIGSLESATRHESTIRDREDEPSKKLLVVRSERTIDEDAVFVGRLVHYRLRSKSLDPVRRRALGRQIA
jgi:hypothetical protein